MSQHGIFEQIGIYGYSKIENIVLSSLVTAEPLLLVGNHGTAKTMLCKKIAQILNMKFIAYDASKSLFEDIIGFPNPYKLKDNIVEYVLTPLSIFDKEFVLIDELSRATYQMQNKWLEIIRSRQVMGLKIHSLKYIFGAMNPPEYVGARILDPSLSGRFAYIVRLPDFSELSDVDQTNIIKSANKEDDIMELRSVSNYENVSVGFFLNRAKSYYSDVEKKYENIIVEFIKNFQKALIEYEMGYKIDGRRAGMMYRSTIAYLSVVMAKKQFDENYLSNYFNELLPYLIPFQVEEENFLQETIEPAIQLAIKLTFSNLYKSADEVLLHDHLFFTRFEESLLNNADIQIKIKNILKLSEKYSSIVNLDIKRRYLMFYDNLWLNTEVDNQLFSKRKEFNKKLTESFIDTFLNSEEQLIIIDKLDVVSLRFSLLCGESNTEFKQIKKILYKLV